MSITIHHYWLDKINDYAFRAELGQTLDTQFSSDTMFTDAAKDKDDFLRQLILHGMAEAVPADVRSALESEDAVNASVQRRRLCSLAGDTASDAGIQMATAAVLALAQGILSVRYVYMGGTDEIDLEQDCEFDCADPSLKLGAWNAWCEACSAARIGEDGIFWMMNNDSGAGSGSLYNGSLTVDLLTLQSEEGEYEFHEDDEDERSYETYSDESPDDITEQTTDNAP